MDPDLIKETSNRHKDGEYKIRGIKCTSFQTQHQINKLSHKVPLGTINPVHKYDDPRRKDKQEWNLEPEVVKKKLWPENKSEKTLLQEHLVNPYIYINNLKVSNDKNSGQIQYNHASHWNTSNNLESWQRQDQLPKDAITNLTQSCNPAILDLAKQEKKITEQRKIIYSANQKIKEDIYDFYQQVKENLDRLEKKFSFAKWFDIYQRKKKIGFQVFRKKNLEDLAKSSASNKNKSQYDENDEYGMEELNNNEEEDQKDPLQIEQENLNNPMHINKHDFTEFILNLGYPKKKKWEIERYFNYCIEGDHIEWGMDVKGHSPRNKQQGEEDGDGEHEINEGFQKNDSINFSTSMGNYSAVRSKNKKSLFSMRCCIFNFKRYLDDQYRVHFILSDRSAHERTVSFKKAIEAYEDEYYENKRQLNEQRDFEDESLFTLQEIMSEFNEPKINQLYRESQAKENQISSSRKISKEDREALEEELRDINFQLEKHMEAYQEKYGNVRTKFEKIINERDELYFKRRVLVKALKPQVKNHLLSIPNPQKLKKIVTDKFQKFNEEERILDQFHNEFLKEKKTYKEENFKLFEIGTFIYDIGYKNEEINIVTKMINKVKGNYNLSQGLEKHDYVNPNTHIPLTLLTQTFQIQKDQAQQELTYLGEVYDQVQENVDKKKQELRDQVDSMKVNERIYKKPEYRNPKIEDIMEKNSTLVFLERIWKKIDRAFKNCNVYILEILKYIEENKGQDNLFLKVLHKIYEVLQEDTSNIEQLLGGDSNNKNKNKYNSKFTSNKNQDNNEQQTDDFALDILNNTTKQRNSVKFGGFKGFNKTDNNNNNNEENERSQQQHKSEFDNDKDISSFLNSNTGLAQSTFNH